MTTLQRCTLSRLQGQILADLAAINGDRQSIDDLAEQWPGRTVSGVRKAVDSLYRKAMVKPAGWKRGWRGRVARSWIITDKGRAATRCVTWDRAPATGAQGGDET